MLDSLVDCKCWFLCQVSIGLFTVYYQGHIEGNLDIELAKVIISVLAFGHGCTFPIFEMYQGSIIMIALESNHDSIVI